ncbi:MAG: RND transporter [Rheinheimera sp.]|uniref:efflux RND transporter permease subunit n=1 Tax=Arsukibacterium sp. UBA3155 TaxID=1946058 RepID=UPI000C8DA845|nr:MMPL family transporter [Arsukibacterium sp. UBA3155]MAD73497.1 RND transporter [Rheinheimera sp.]|tara:strand:+ start:34340 stop:36652 length:2313 start_codon:yes stop_codon:yes gene_type:complete
MIQRALQHILGYPRVVTALCLLIIVGSGWGIGNLYFRGDYRIFFSNDNPQLQAFEQMQQQFNKSDNILIAIAPADKQVFSAETLDLVRQLTEAAWQTPYSIRVDSLSNYQHTEAIADDLWVADLVGETLELNNTELNKIAGVALNEPVLKKRLVSANGSVTAINITLQLPEQNLQHEVKEVWQAISAMLETFKASHPDTAFHVSGVVAMNYAFAYEAENDVKTLIPVMFAAILLMLAWLLRSLLASLATLVIIVVTVVSTLGLAGWAGLFLSTATVNVPTILMTLAVADSVHLIAAMQFALRRGDSRLQAIQYSLKRNSMPVFITSATTAIGFLTLNFSEVPILRDLGNMTAVGVMLACLFSLVLLPALLLFMPISAGQGKHSAAGSSDKSMLWLANKVIRWQQPLFWGMTLLILGCSSLISRNIINDEAVKYFAADTEFRQANDFLEQNLTGATTVDFVIGGNEAGAVNEPEFLEAVADFASWLQRQPEVQHVNSITDTIRRLNKNMNLDDPAFYRLPDNRQQSAQYLLMYEMSLPFGLDLNNQLNLDKSATRVAVSLHNLGSKQLTAFETRALAYLAENAGAYSATAASTALMFAHIGEKNMASMLQTLPLALLLISLLLVFSLRSWRLGLISLIPNITPALVAFGLWGVLSGEINLALSVVAGMSLGIIVDDTVHFLSKYRAARLEGQATEQAIRYAFTTVGRALWITTVVLITGFGVLMLSGFRLNSDMGMLTALVILVALIIDFLFLPACLLKFDAKEYKTDGTP